MYDTVDTVHDCVRIATGVLSTLRIRPDRMLKGSCTCTCTCIPICGQQRCTGGPQVHAMARVHRRAGALAVLLLRLYAQWLFDVCTLSCGHIVAHCLHAH
jgi:hypothetical protein